MDFGFLSSTTIVGDLLVVCGWHFGLFWVFSLEDGRLKRLIRLYDEVTDDDLRQDRKFEVVVHFQPQKDGTLLVAARVEEAVKALGKAMGKGGSAGQGDGPAGRGSSTRDADGSVPATGTRCNRSRIPVHRLV